LIQYHACGIPAIASPTGVNPLITLHNKTGYIANNREEWKIYLKKLIGDASLRASMGKEGRKHIEEKYSLHSLFPAFGSLFS
jgi:glycosyltransferase involved in cell wall biosynthesis